jgi:lysophospholipase L1-like esterase
MSTNPSPASKHTPARKRLWPRLALSAGTLILALGLIEIAMRILGLPKVLEPHSETARFAFAEVSQGHELFYANQPGRITFRYDGNPRGYFDARNEVHHDVSPTGFRGPAFQPKAAGTLRMVFLGDSFTFGEGVRNEHTYAEVTARLLRIQGQQADPCNLGVGGYNTTQSLRAARLIGFGLEPDVVVLGYTLNDAEPPLFEIDKATGRPVRRPRERFIEAEAAPKKPLATGIYRLRLARAFWQIARQQELSRQTIEYYRSINDPENTGFIESERALKELIAECKKRNIPCIVVLFPLLFELSEDYPFQDAHQRIGSIVTNAGGTFIDLLPALRGKNAASLIVHPTDQHPNELVHEIAGGLLANEIVKKTAHSAP